MKRVVAMLMVLLLSIESFGAIVSDNDGSAFITKAEFDSLKNDFQSQIDQYNTSIDSKIDGAIAAYLSGIKIDTTTTLTDMITAAKDNNANNVKFAKWKTPVATQDVHDVEAGFIMSRLAGVSWANNESGAGLYGFCIWNNSSAWDGQVRPVRYTNFTGDATNFTSAYYYAKFPFGTGNDADNVTEGNVQDWYLPNISRWRLHVNLRSTIMTFTSAQISANLEDITYPPASVTVDFTTNANAKAGPATFGGASVSFGAFELTPTNSITHTLSIRDSSDATNNDFLNYNISGTIPSTTTRCIDYDYRNNYYASQTSTLTIQKDQKATTTDGSKSGANISFKKGNLSWQEVVHKDSNYNNFEFKWKYNRTKLYSLAWNRLTNQYYDQLMQKPWYKYYGIPLCKTPTKKGSLKLTINVSHSSGNGAVVRIMDKPFPNGAMPTTDKEGGIDHVLWKSGPATYQNSTWKNQVIQKEKIWDTTNGDYLYIKVEPANDTQVVTVSITGDIVYTEDNS